MMNHTEQRNFLDDLELVEVERGIGEFRAGRPVIVTYKDQSILCAAIETMGRTLFDKIVSLGPQKASLALSQARLNYLGHVLEGPGTLKVGSNTPDILLAMSVEEDFALPQAPQPADAGNAAAVELVRLSLLLPAVVTIAVNGAMPDMRHVVRVDAAAIARYRAERAVDLKIIASAPVPLEIAGETRFVVFRGGEGLRDQIAVIIGEPDPSGPVLVRIHSACLTGDLFGSLKCDCGDQLRAALMQISELGDGVILYLDQEGRGNGISNKLRAYGLQAGGHDTFSADAILGFDLDQRRFDFAAAMLKQLGYLKIRLLTNNPSKIHALIESGLDVVSTQRITGRLTEENADYLAMKRKRAGHLVGDAALARLDVETD